jgi:hypothetical protein
VLTELGRTPYFFGAVVLTCKKRDHQHAPCCTARRRSTAPAP